MKFIILTLKRTKEQIHINPETIEGMQENPSRTMLAMTSNGAIYVTEPIKTIKQLIKDAEEL